ncbi:MAG: ribosome-binding factor A [Candidatus Yonathbacteria bacterium]|nr:ribosome-binding factor A [Candidatus Yonathbacteria bacterium]
MTTPRQDKMRAFLRAIAAEFFTREAGHRSLITVTDATISPDFKHGTIYITCFPTSEEGRALDFAKRKRSDLREYIKSHAHLKALPILEVKIDEGERNRQRIDELGQQG